MVTKLTLTDLVGDLLHEEAALFFELADAPDGDALVHTPLLYPDGEVVDVYVREAEGAYLVTDRGGAHFWLRTAACFRELTECEMSLIGEVQRSLGLEGEGVELAARVADVEQVTWAIHRVALAAVRVADISYTCGGTT